MEPLQEESKNLDISKIPDILYFGSNRKLTKIGGKTYLSPYIGIASIFIFQRKDFKILRNKKKFNLDFLEWSLPNSKLTKPLDTVHIIHNVKEIKTVEHGISYGYIYTIDARNIKHKLQLDRYSKDYEREFIFTGYNEWLTILNIQEHKIKWSLKFGYDMEPLQEESKNLLDSKYPGGAFFQKRWNERENMNHIIVKEDNFDEVKIDFVKDDFDYSKMSEEYYEGIFLKERWNEVIWIKEKPFRNRSEVLIFKENKLFLRKFPNPEEEYKYTVPGGGNNEYFNETKEETVRREAKEEARININDIRKTDISYIKIFGYNTGSWDPFNKKNFDWSKEMLDKSFKYYGDFTTIFVAEFDSSSPNLVDKEDIDNDMTNNGKFYEFEEIKDILYPYHLEAIKKFKPYLFHKLTILEEFNNYKYNIGSIMEEKIENLNEDFDSNIIRRKDVDYLKVERYLYLNNNGEAILSSFNEINSRNFSSFFNRREFIKVVESFEENEFVSMNKHVLVYKDKKYNNFVYNTTVILGSIFSELYLNKEALLKKFNITDDIGKKFNNAIESSPFLYKMRQIYQRNNNEIFLFLEDNCLTEFFGVDSKNIIPNINTFIKINSDLFPNKDIFIVDIRRSIGTNNFLNSVCNNKISIEINKITIENSLIDEIRKFRDNL